MIVVFVSDDPSGLAAMVGDLIEQNLARDPARLRLLRPSIVSITAPDAGVSITITTTPGHVEVGEGTHPAASIAITADASSLLGLTASPLRFGLPDAFDRRGRAVLRDVLTRRVRIRGMFAHPRRLARLSLLLSAV
ncbi:MAG: hypothetical protein ACXVPL_06355 [Actinomycetota bacterium]